MSCELICPLHAQMKYRSPNRYLKVNKHLRTWMNYILTFGLSTHRIRNSVYYLSFSSIVTYTMRGIFRFSFSSHQINQFYEQQIGESSSNAQICHILYSLILTYPLSLLLILHFHRSVVDWLFHRF